MTDKDISSLEHTGWRCQYHIVFAPKYRRMEIYGQIKQDIGDLLRKLYQQKEVELIEAKACPDHIHMLVRIPPNSGLAGRFDCFAWFPAPNESGLGSAQTRRDLVPDPRRPLKRAAEPSRRFHCGEDRTGGAWGACERRGQGDRSWARFKKSGREMKKTAGLNRVRGEGSGASGFHRHQ